MNYHSIFEEKWKPRPVEQPVLQPARPEPSQELAKLQAELVAKKSELAEARTQIEIMVTAMHQAHVPVPNVGEPDAVEIAHRVTSLIRRLREENARLAHKATDAYTSQLEIDLALLRG